MSMSLPITVAGGEGWAGALSQAPAMRALAAILIFAVWSRGLHAHNLTQTQHSLIARVLQSLLGSTEKPVRRLVSCSQTLGPTKCLNSLSVWRAERAIGELTKGHNAEFNLTADVEQFPWNRYMKTSEEQLHSQLCNGTAKLLRYRPMSLTMIPGYSLKLETNEDGNVNIDVFKSNATESGRGSMKKAHKMFYKIVPFLLLPGLIMSAVLPFVLPALKMMTMGVVMLNNMALSGAIFTLLRNNAFDDRYEHKVLYVNEGYKNEKHAHFAEKPYETHESYDYIYGDTKTHNHQDSAVDFDVIEESPLNSHPAKGYATKKYVVLENDKGQSSRK